MAGDSGSVLLVGERAEQTRQLGDCCGLRDFYDFDPRAASVEALRSCA